jgi:hypothetical protein
MPDMDNDGKEENMKLLVSSFRKRMFSGALAIMVVAPTHPVRAESIAVEVNSDTTTAQQGTSRMLSGVSGLIKWVSEITPLLRAQGDEADRNKLRGSLTNISKQLASTGTINDAVVTNLKATQPNYDKLRSQLTDLRNADASIADSIAAIRSQLHLTGQAETDFERNASDAIMAKGAEVDTMLGQLKYSAPKNPDELHVLQVKSEELKALLRQADDAISKAFRALQP